MLIKYTDHSRSHHSSSNQITANHITSHHTTSHHITSDQIRSDHITPHITIRHSISELVIILRHRQPTHLPPTHVAISQTKVSVHLAAVENGISQLGRHHALTRVPRQIYGKKASMSSRQVPIRQRVGVVPCRRLDFHSLAKGRSGGRERGACPHETQEGALLLLVKVIG